MIDEAIRRVTVFGGGIAGLTAAHELAERGFSVQLVECAADPDEYGRPGLVIGGLARSQYRRIPRPRTRAELDTAARGISAPREAERIDLPSIYPIPVTRDDHGCIAPAEIGRTTLAELVTHLGRGLADYSVRIDGDGAGVQATAELLFAAGIARERVFSEPAAAGTSVVVRLIESRLPGEHGFRFFPAFYRHLADTMRRTPLGDGRCAFDNLVPVQTQLFTRPGYAPTTLGRGGHRSLEALHKELAAWLKAVGFSSRDMAWYVLRLLRFITSCSGRRATTYEALSWWDFLTLRHLDEPDARLPYSGRTLDFLRHAPRALVAMDPVHCDARTQGNMLVQLLRDQIAQEGPIDAALNGPTSSAWLSPWRRYLEDLGVRFFHGRLLPVAEPQTTDRGRLRVAPQVQEASPGGLAGYVTTADYYVLALDLVAAQRITKRLAAWAGERDVAAGVITELQPFACEVPEPSGGPAHTRDPETETGASGWDRLQTLTGIQFYFGQRVELAKGYVYYTESPWALTSIGQSFRWRQQPTLLRDGYLALHSVDIGDFGQQEWRRTKAEIARESLRQIRVGIAGAGPDLCHRRYFTIWTMRSSLPMARMVPDRLPRTALPTLSTLRGIGRDARVRNHRIRAGQTLPPPPYEQSFCGSRLKVAMRFTLASSSSPAPGCVPSRG